MNDKFQSQYFDVVTGDPWMLSLLLQVFHHKRGDEIRLEKINNKLPSGKFCLVFTRCTIPTLSRDPLKFHCYVVFVFTPCESSHFSILRHWHSPCWIEARLHPFARRSPSSWEFTLFERSSLSSASHFSINEISLCPDKHTLEKEVKLLMKCFNFHSLHFAPFLLLYFRNFPSE